MICVPHFERLRVEVPAARVVAGLAMCDRCFLGKAIRRRIEEIGGIRRDRRSGEGRVGERGPRQRRLIPSALLAEQQSNIDEQQSKIGDQQESKIREQQSNLGEQQSNVTLDTTSGWSKLHCSASRPLSRPHAFRRRSVPRSLL